ncbi:MAG: glutathione S-transferase family protein [Alphaproteobacteria bacterium]
MPELTIYGNLRSRASRAVWCARELGLPFEMMDVTGKTKEPDYLAINPNGKIPAIADGDLRLFESLAITLYLSRRYGMGKLYPTRIEDEAKVLQWTLWAATEAKPDVLPILYHRVMNRPETTAEAADAAETRLRKTLRVLDNALQGREWLVGTAFSVADLNVAGVLSTTIPAKVDYSALPHVKAWLTRCLARRDQAIAG